MDLSSLLFISLRRLPVLTADWSLMGDVVCLMAILKRAEGERKETLVNIAYI